METKIKGNPKTSLLFHSVLTSGEILPGARDAYAYRAQDVKVGDVIVACAYKDDIDKEIYAAYISIRARPGGVIPPSQNPDKNGDPYHIPMNAIQRWEYEGIQIPKAILDRNFLGQHPPPPMPLAQSDPPKGR